MLSIPKPCFKRRFEACGPDAAQIEPVRLAMIGDSLSTGFHVSSPLMMLLRTRTCKGNWVVDDKGTIDSIFERLSRKMPVILDHFAYVSADVRPSSRRSIADRVAGTFDMSYQVERILKLDQFPEIVVLWIGHNNLDWAMKLQTPDGSPAQFSKLADRITSCYEAQLRRLLEVAAKQDHSVHVIVFALVNFETFFRARKQAEVIRQRDPSKYPFLEVDYRYFRSMRPEFRTGMIGLADAVNTRLRNLVAKWEEYPANDRNVHLTFSTALHDVDIDRAEMLNNLDAWHPSELGHRRLAEGAYREVYESAVKQRGLT